MSAAVPDFEAMSLEELRNYQPPAEATTPESVTPESVTPEVPEVEVPEMFVREIDLGDGSGVQVFKAETLEELVDKLAEAQTHATRKIREQNALLQNRPPAPVVPTVNPDEEAALAQAILSEPSAAIRSILERELGMTVKEAKAKLQAAQEVQSREQAQAAGLEFVNTTPEYYGCPENEARMIKYLQTYQLPNTVEAIRTAFNDLNASGLLAKKPGPKTQQADQGIPETPVKRAASGLSARRSAPVVIPSGPTIDDLYSMPLEQLKELGNRQSQ